MHIISPAIDKWNSQNFNFIITFDSGLHQFGSFQEGEPWKWASTGSALTPEDFDWGPGEPNGALDVKSDCIEMGSQKQLLKGEGYWNDHPCSIERYPICHYPCDSNQQVHRNHFYPNFSTLQRKVHFSLVVSSVNLLSFQKQIEL